MSTEAMMLRATELQDELSKARQKLMNLYGALSAKTDLVDDLQDQMLCKDAVVGDLQEQVSEAHSTNSDILAHNIQLNIHQEDLAQMSRISHSTLGAVTSDRDQNSSRHRGIKSIGYPSNNCHTQFSSFTAISEGTQKTLQVRLKMASEISDAEFSSLRSLLVQVDTPKVDWWAWAGSRGVSGTVRVDVTFKTLFVWFELIVYLEELTWGSSKKSQVKKNLLMNSCKSIKQNDHVESDHVF
ncbi:hypothetical protein K438DRAFT_1747365 [Mycena galopus ATCC 62051]|nr:hypothetical protein K438DRAFT_1747365 [Mycena galopus ATCC 62051]